MFRPCDTPINRRNTRWKRPLGVLWRRSGTDGCSPMMSLNSGDKIHNDSSVRTQNASRSASRQLRSFCSSVLLRKRRIRPLKACAKVA